jgi:hypothetical protein
MAQATGLHAGRAAELDEKRAALASLGGRPVAAALDEMRAALASLGGRRVAAARLDVVLLSPVQTAWLQTSTAAFYRRRAPALQSLGQPTRRPYHLVRDPSQQACRRAGG